MEPLACNNKTQFFENVNCFRSLVFSKYLRQSPCHNSLEPIPSIITTIPEIVLVFMQQLSQLEQVIERSAIPRDILSYTCTFGTTIHKQ